MGKRSFLQRLIILPILGLLFATFSNFINPLPAYAEPETPSNNSFVENLVGPTDNNQEATQKTEEKPTERSAFVENLIGPTDESASQDDKNKSEDENAEPNCYDVVGSLGWIICPVTSVISTGVDTLYGIINNFLAIEPITFNENSSTYIVWAIARDIANIVFIILILVVIFSQITGVGFDSYNIKKTLPRIIIAAILVNLSFLICSLAVDSSNIIGASIKGLFDSITETVKQNNANLVGELSWQAIVGQIVGTIGTGAGATVIAGSAIALSGGLGHFIWLLIPVVLGAIISLAIGVFTIALRQAVVSLLVMLAPLAFVAYLLPNTESWFKKWKDTLIQMLIFFPMFAALYGASNLAGWTFITNGVQNSSAIEIIVGMAIQVFPLIMSFKLLKMSDTILGKVNETLTNWSQPAQNAIKNFSATQAATAKAKYDANNLSRKYTGISKLSAGNLRSFAAKRQHEMETNRKYAESRRQSILEAYNAAREVNKTIDFDKNGRMIFSKDTNTKGMNSAMEYALRAKEAELNLAHLNLEHDNMLSQPNDHLIKAEGIKSAELEKIIARNADNFTDLKTQTNAKRRNDLSDEQFYASEVLRASKLSHDSEDYQRLIVKGGGANALNTTNKAIQNSALTSVISNAYDITEAEREADIKRLSTFFNTQPTENVEAELKNAMKNNDVNSIIAGLNTLDARGDGDKVAKYVREFMDTGQLKLATEYANNLAKTMLFYGENPLIKGLGKFINVETLAYTEGRRQNDTITFKEFVTGTADFDDLNLDANGNPKAYVPKYDIISTTSGKDFTKANRTTMKAYMEAMEAYRDDPTVNNAMMEQRILELDDKIRPQLVSSIPTYNSGSEEIMAAVKYLTGYAVKDGKLQFNGKVEGADGQDIQLSKEFFRKRTTKYLKAFTPSDLIKMKSDVLAAVTELFTEVNNGDKDAAKAEFQAIFANAEDGGNDALSTLLAGDLSVIGGMKANLRNLLDLDAEHLQDTLDKYSINRKTK